MLWNKVNVKVSHRKIYSFTIVKILCYCPQLHNSSNNANYHAKCYILKKECKCATVLALLTWRQDIYCYSCFRFLLFIFLQVVHLVPLFLFLVIIYRFMKAKIEVFPHPLVENHCSTYLHVFSPFACVSVLPLSASRGQTGPIWQLLGSVAVC